VYGGSLKHGEQGVHVGNGNISTQKQNIIIEDYTAPVPEVALLPDIYAECEVSTLTLPTATDNCADNITATQYTTLPITGQGTTIVTWIYADGNGNVSTQKQNIIINDDIAPIADLASLSDITDECEVASLTAPTATDNCAGTLTGTHDVTLPISAQGTTIVTWTYDDGNGNTETQTQNIVISDITAPTITCIDNQTIEIAEGESGYTILGTEFDPTVTDDNCTLVSIENNFNYSASLNESTLPVGTTTITWTATDGYGNITDCSFDIMVTAPTSINNITSTYGINIYPNPAQNYIVIASKPKKSFESIAILDITGKKIKQLSVNTKKQTVDVSYLQKGVYLIKVDTRIFKFIKE
jgi:hypothetical protein